MTEAFKYAARALEHIRVLAEEIGPRPAGSAAERRARDYVAAQLAAWGYSLRRQEVAFAPIRSYSGLQVLHGLALVAAAYMLPTAPLPALIIPILIALGLPWLLRQEIHSRRRTHHSQNLIALPESEDPRPLLLLCAHLDSATAAGPQFRVWRWLHAQSNNASRRLANILGVLAFLTLLNLYVPPLLYDLALAAGVAIGGWIVVSEFASGLIGIGRFSPGANDNASGVAVALALAERFAAAPPRHIHLGFLFTAAEETGLHGAEAFAAELADRPGACWVLNLDMLGAGDRLAYLERDGGVFRARGAEQLNALIRTADPHARGLWYMMRSSDFLPFLRRGIPTSGLEMIGSETARLASHSIYDTLEQIEPAALEHAAQVVYELICRLDSQTNRPATP